MRVLVVGGYGLIGGYVVSALIAAGHEVVGAGRSVASAKLRFPGANWIRADLGADSLSDWRARLDGVEAVVNCAGALQDSATDRLEAVHASGLRVLASAAQELGVRRFVQISAIGVTADQRAFGRTKAEGEVALQALDLEWIILRPGLVLAPAAFGGSALLRGLAAFPFVIPAVYADAQIQVIAASDLAQAVGAALRPNAPTRVTVDLAGPSQPLRHILSSLRAWLGIKPAPVVGMPIVLARLNGWAADGVAWLGWRSPMRTAALEQLARGVQADGAPTALPGVRVRSLAALLSDMPSGVQERWFARLYFCKPIVIVLLALFWMASGAIGLARLDAASSVLLASGAPRWSAEGAVVAGSLVDILLGAALCVRAWATFALRGMLLVSAAYLVGASLLRPDLWADPLGPLVKIVPAAALALVLLGVMDER